LRVVVGSDREEADAAAIMEVVLDRDLLPGPLLLRARRPGDRVWPVGMEGSKKLQDILVDSKVPLRQRDRVPVLAAGDQAIWLVGYRLDRRFLASPSTRNPLVLRLFPL
jgi:tRNA(Ile)-lysidine synthase